MGWLVFLVMVIIVVFALMRLLRPKIRTRGTSPVRMCECGEPRGRCRHRTRQSETAGSFQGSLPQRKRRR